MSKKDIVNSKNIKEEELEGLKWLFPQFFSEWKIDIDWLKNYLEWNIVDSDEFYRFEWTWKKEAKQIASKPTKNTLVPDRENSRDWDNTENIFIEWDNLEVLKLLLNKYYGQIKMIYIDPPYNKDKDFVYKDTWKDGLDDYLKQTGQKDEEWETTTEKESSWRMHSNWLNMICPRLLLARKLLRDDGVIFISIDDNEGGNLKKVSDDVFGEDSYLWCITWNNRTKPKNIWKAKYSLQNNQEYVHVYCKSNKNSFRWFDLPTTTEKKYPFEEDWKKYRIEEIQQRKNLGSMKRDSMVYELLGISPKENYRWQLSKDARDRHLNANTIYENKWKIYIKIFQENEDGFAYEPFWTYRPDVDTAETAKEDLELLMWKDDLFDTVKPINLLYQILSFFPSDVLILDFFAGSWTTAHAVMELNKNDEWKRKCISVQLPELIDEKTEAYRAGYRFISEITRERIKRAWDKIRLEEGGDKVDVWFKAFKLSESNFKYMQEDYILTKDSDIEQIEIQMQKELSQSGLVEWRSDEDVIYELIIREWYSFSSVIEKWNNWIYSVIDGDKYFYLLVNHKISDETLKLFIKEHLEEKHITFFSLEDCLQESQRATLSTYFKLKNI